MLSRRFTSFSESFWYFSRRPLFDFSTSIYRGFNFMLIKTIRQVIAELNGSQAVKDLCFDIFIWGVGEWRHFQGGCGSRGNHVM